MPVAAALASGLPLVIGSSFDRLDYGLVASLGGLVFLYLPATSLPHRMIRIVVCSFALATCYALGLLSHVFPLLLVPALMFISIAATMLVRCYALGQPGSLFFVMVAAIGAYTPSNLRQMPLLVVLFSLGTLLACLIAFLYSMEILRCRKPDPLPKRPETTFDFIVFDSVIIGICVGFSLFLALALRMQKPYWVPVACLTVIQGTTLRAVWNRQLHRILGTTIGLLLAWAILALPPEKWSIAASVTMLMFLVETMVVRNYAVAAMFITPLAILLAEAATLGQAAPGALVMARFNDTVLGAVVGFLGGVCLHSLRFRRIAGDPLRRLLGAKMKTNQILKEPRKPRAA